MKRITNRVRRKPKKYFEETETDYLYTGNPRQLTSDRWQNLINKNPFEMNEKIKTQCTGETGEGKRCTRSVTSSSAPRASTRTICDGPYCWQHDGPGPEGREDALMKDFMQLLKITDDKPYIPHWENPQPKSLPKPRVSEL